MVVLFVVVVVVSTINSDVRIDETRFIHELVINKITQRYERDKVLEF